MLSKFGVSYINQEMFLKEFAKTEQVHAEDLIARVKHLARKHYATFGAPGDGAAAELSTVAELRKTDYFS